VAGPHFERFVLRYLQTGRTGLRVTTRGLSPCLGGLCGSPSTVGDLDEIPLEMSAAGCVSPGPDAGMADAGLPDAGGVDAGAAGDAEAPPDGGGPATDGGGDPGDGSAPGPDDGGPSGDSPDAGCSCRATGAAAPDALPVLRLLAWRFVRRRQRQTQPKVTFLSRIRLGGPVRVGGRDPGSHLPA
jgi:hypothetical protein